MNRTSRESAYDWPSMDDAAYLKNAELQIWLVGLRCQQPACPGTS